MCIRDRRESSPNRLWKFQGAPWGLVRSALQKLTESHLQTSQYSSWNPKTNKHSIKKNCFIRFWSITSVTLGIKHVIAIIIIPRALDHGLMQTTLVLHAVMRCTYCCVDVRVASEVRLSHPNCLLYQSNPWQTLAANNEPSITSMFWDIFYSSYIGMKTYRVNITSSLRDTTRLREHLHALDQWFPMWFLRTPRGPWNREGCLLYTSRCV